MSDSASDPKVEDVLSSVRRLVSGEIPRKTRAPLPKGPGALVLTDEDRVQRDPLVRAASRSLEDRIAELEAAVDSGSEEFEPDGSEDQTENVPDRIVYTRPPSTDEEEHARGSALRLSEIALIPTAPANDTDELEEGALVQFRHGETGREVPKGAEDFAETQGPVADMGDSEGPTDGPETVTYAEVQYADPGFEEHTDVHPQDHIEVEAPMAVDVPTEERRRGEVRAFTNPDDVVERIEARIDRGEENVPEAPIAVRSELDPADTRGDSTENMLREDVDQGDVDIDPDFDAALSEAVEASVSSAVFEKVIDAGLIAEDSENEAEAATADAEDDTAEVELTELPFEIETLDEQEAALSEEKATSDETEPTLADQTAGATASLSDEDALRFIVGRLIREELQGELGERITRNVRKLVRREIKRALNARDLI